MPPFISPSCSFHGPNYQVGEGKEMQASGQLGELTMSFPMSYLKRQSRRAEGRTPCQDGNQPSTGRASCIQGSQESWVCLRETDIFELNTVLPCREKPGTRERPVNPGRVTTYVVQAVHCTGTSWERHRSWKQTTESSGATGKILASWQTPNRNGDSHPG